MHYLKTFTILSSLFGFGLVLWYQLLTQQARSWLNVRYWVVIPIVAVGLYGPSLWAYYCTIFFAMLLLPRSRIEAAGLFIILTLALPLVSYDFFVGSAFIMRLKGHTIAAIALLAAFRFPSSKVGQSAGGAGITATVVLFIALQIMIDSRLAVTGPTTVLRNIIGEVLTLGVPYALVSSSMDSRTDDRQPVFYLVTAGFILSIIAAFEMSRHWPLYQTIESHLGTAGALSKTLAVRGGLLRAPGPFYESTTFGVFLAVTTACTASMRTIFRSKAFHIAAVAIGCLGCFATLSRNAWIGVVIGMVILSLYRGQIARTVSAGVLATVAGLALIVASPNSGSVASLLGKGDTSAAGTATYRQDLLNNSIPLIRSSPWIGTPYYRVAEIMRPVMRSGKLSVDYVNTYLFYAVAAGLLGLSLFVALIFTPIYSLYTSRSLLMSRFSKAETAAGLFSSQVALAMMLVGTSFAERMPVLGMLLIGMTRLSLKYARKGATEPSPTLTGTSRPDFIIVDPSRPKLTQTER